MNRARVLYMGYGLTGCFCLNELHAAGVEICGVLCREGDRDEKENPEASLYGLARKLDLRCFDVKNPNAPEFVAEATRLQPDYTISVQYDRLLKVPMLGVPKHGSLNLHFGPLPRMRGCFPTKWAIIHNEPSGVTFHHIDNGIDSGAVIDQVIVSLAPDETDQTLYRRLEAAGKELFQRQIPSILALQVAEGTRQDETAASYHPKKPPFDGIIDWSWDASFIERFIRAFTFPPYPAAKTFLDRSEIQVRAPTSVDPAESWLQPGEFEFDRHSIRVRCGHGSLRIQRILFDNAEHPALVLAPRHPYRFGVIA